MWLVTRFVPDHENVTNQRVRDACGRLGGIVGIVVNLALGLLKGLTGYLAGSVSVVADAVNNLTDACSSVIALFSFKLSGKPADTQHPFGHQRIEYVASVAVAVIILLLGFQLGKSSLLRLIHGERSGFEPWAFAALLFSVLAKLWLYRFHKKLGEKVDSSVLRASAVDALTDVWATLAVLLSQCLGPFVRFSLDGAAGLAVACFVVTAGVQVLRESMDKLLGSAPSPETLRLIEEHILRCPDVLGMHDLMLHSYGPGRHFATAHVEMDASEDIMQSHARIDDLERELAVDHSIHLVLHLDPVQRGDKRTEEARAQAQSILQGLGEGLTLHDFRLVKGEKDTNWVFDVSVPDDFPMEMEEMQKKIVEAVRAIDKNYYAVVTLDREYTGTPSDKLH